MRVTCENCGAQYHLADRVLKDGSRPVRCTACGHTWTQKLQRPDELSEPAAEEAPAPVYEGAPVPPEILPDPPAPDFQQVLEQVAQGEAAPPPAPAVERPVIENLPGGMAATPFGASVFLLLLFPTLILIVLLRGPVVNAMPAANGFYGMIGMSVSPPGAGLRFSEMLADIREVGDRRTLALSGRLTNMTGAGKPYPSLRIAVLDTAGEELKYWEIHPEGAELQPEESIPVALTFDEVPEAAATATIRIIKS